MSMLRKYCNHTRQTNPGHREESPQNSNNTAERQLKQSNQLSLPRQDDCKGLHLICFLCLTDSAISDDPDENGPLPSLVRDFFACIHKDMGWMQVQVKCLTSRPTVQL